MEQKSDRLISLDVFRGLTVAGMILVNNPGSWGHIYPALGHAKWHGVTPTDLIFPFFLFIVGVAITLSLTKRKERGDDINKLILTVVKRSALIFLTGLALASFPFFNYSPANGYSWYDFSTIRIPGVLQRIAIVYLFASIIFLKTSWKTQMYIGIGLIVLYWFLMKFIPVPGVGYPNLEPATNLGAWLDNLLLKGHLWKSSKVWDPEGLLSTVPAVTTAISGMMLGHWLATKNDPAVKAVWMFVVGNFLILMSMFWDMNFPINKGLWTSSYVLYTSGMALLVFGMCYWIVDVKKYNWWTKPFLVYGMNAIAVFFLSGAMARVITMIYIDEKTNLKGWLYKSFYLSWLDPMNASFAWAISYVLFWLGMMWILYTKKIFIKL